MKKVLIIDDDKSSRFLVKKILETKKDIALLEAENGAEGLNILEENEDIQLILLDLIMPVMNGQDFLKKMLSEGYKIPVVVLTTDDENARTVNLLGAKEYMIKPISPVSLLEIISKYLKD